MLNFQGLWYRIWGSYGIILLLGIAMILFSKPWRRDFTFNRKYWIGLAAFIFSMCMILEYISRIISPDVCSFTGKYIASHRNSRVAPPLPFTFEYVFSDGKKPDKVFYLDVVSEKNIFECDLQYGNDYTVYYDTLTKIIVRVEYREVSS